jgi:hypothetical protein
MRKRHFFGNIIVCLAIILGKRMLKSHGSENETTQVKLNKTQSPPNI